MTKIQYTKFPNKISDNSKVRYKSHNIQFQNLFVGS
jgi:hypothetical protein